jgi:hypothetical protein
MRFLKKLGGLHGQKCDIISLAKELRGIHRHKLWVRGQIDKEGQIHWQF